MLFLDSLASVSQLELISGRVKHFIKITFLSWGENGESVEPIEANFNKGDCLPKENVQLQTSRCKNKTFIKSNLSSTISSLIYFFMIAFLYMQQSNVSK